MIISLFHFLWKYIFLIFIYNNSGDKMKSFAIKVLGVILGIAVVGECCFISVANSISDSVVRESIKSELLTGFIYEDDGRKTEIFNTIVRLTKLDEETVIKLMENETANEIITDVVDSIYDYNLTGDASYKYTRDRVISIVEDNIDKVLSEIDYYISSSDRNEVISYTRNNTDYILDVIYSTDIGDYKK